MRGKVQVNYCHNSFDCTTPNKYTNTDKQDNAEPFVFNVRLLRNGILETVRQFNDINFGENTKYENFDKASFKGLIRHLLSIKNGRYVVKGGPTKDNKTACQLQVN